VTDGWHRIIADFTSLLWVRVEDSDDAGPPPRRRYRRRGGP
jgi:hypothetical protein